ncbi:hypothetical protein DM01DRAFT_1324906 [Hesseltinella vesiculosa]|uniref:DUF336-domain-containing protein n=1 Tax=Hesseltinella vesiculosa TaxID=101127 RepID=A0A1X2GCA5_9FUNG|nr:hypothetical protein DM01DRAFT_1324906 [Hesseltinella vesiculosa]
MAVQEAQKLLEKIEEQEQRLQFDTFSSQDALEIGQLILKHVQNDHGNRPVAIDITANGMCVFRFAMDGTSPDNEAWIKRKSNTVNRFRHSSYWMGNSLIVKGRTLEQGSFISEYDYATHGGSFPLHVKNVGMIGTITVTGLKQWEDHGVIVASLEEYLTSK